VVDDLDGDATGRWFLEGAREVAVERFPGVLVDLGLECGLERLVGVVLAQEVGVAHEEALTVVVRVQEPAGDAIGVVALDLARAGVEHVHAVDLHLVGAVGARVQGDIGLAEDHEQVALCGGLQFFGKVKVRMHSRLQDR